MRRALYAHSCRRGLYSRLLRLTLSLALLCIAATTAAVDVARADHLRPTPTSQPAYDRFQSPTGNIRCVYVDQTGVACMTLNNGQGVYLRSFDRAYYLNRWTFHPPPGRTLAYGRTWRISSFRCHSSYEGIECWSTVTHHGFFINRTTRRTF